MHTYASVGTLKDYLRDSGSAVLGTSNDAGYLAVLEAASRRVDSFCDRSAALSGSWTGFGPRIGTNRYDGCGWSELRLEDDLVTLTELTLASITGGTPTALTAEIDYYLAPYSGPPYRVVLLTGLGVGPSIGLRVWTATGTWSGPGYGTRTCDATVASGLASDPTATTFILSPSPDISPGDTLLIGSEQIYIQAVNGTTAQVVRGANGTTADTHPDASAIAAYTYHPSVVDGTLQIAARRLRSRDAGLSGEFMAGNSVVVQRDSEWQVLLSTVGVLRAGSIA